MVYIPSSKATKFPFEIFPRLKLYPFPSNLNIIGILVKTSPVVLDTACMVAVTSRSLKDVLSFIVLKAISILLVSLEFALIIVPL